MKNLPKRTCIGCNEIKLKKELIRIVKNKDGQITVDKTGKAQGRGAYVCNNIQCLESAIRYKKLEKKFECKIDEELYENLRNEMKST